MSQTGSGLAIHVFVLIKPGLIFITILRSYHLAYRIIVCTLLYSGHAVSLFQIGISNCKRTYYHQSQHSSIYLLLFLLQYSLGVHAW